MLPLILAPAALVFLAQTPAVQGPVVEGQVLNQAGKPIPATLGLIPMFQRDEPFPAKIVENRTVKTKKSGPGFTLPVPAPGLYVLEVRARGSKVLQLPLLLGEEGLQGLELTPIPLKVQGEPKPLSADPKIVKLESLYTAQKAREVAYRAAIKARYAKKSEGGITETGAPVDWTTDLDTLATDLRNETDPDIQTLAAVSYLELGMMMAKLDPDTASLALDKLPASSPWWAFNPRMASGAFTAAKRNAEWGAFREALVAENPDREVRAYSLYSQVASAFHKGDKDRFTSLVDTLKTEYQGTKFAKSVKTFDPAKMPAPAPVAPVDTPMPSAEEPPVVEPPPTETPTPSPEVPAPDEAVPVQP